MERKPIPDNRIRRVMDASLPGLEHDPWFEDRVLQRIRQSEEKPVRRRRKLSVVLVVALVLVLMTATAVAATVLYRYYARNIAVEAAHGYYQAWPLEEKIAMVDRMQEEGIEIDAAQAGQLHDRSLTDEEKEAIADEIVIGYYGEGHDGVLSAANIMEHDMGQFNTWSLEDQAWFSEQQLASGHEQATYEFHKMPGEDDMPVEEALAYARELLAQSTDYDLEDIITWNTIVSFSSEQISDGVNPTHMEDIYQFGFYEPGNDVYPYWVQLSHDGQLMRMEEAHPVDNVNDYFLKYVTYMDTPESKAIFARDYAPMIKQLAEEGYNIQEVYLWLASIDYIMPNDQYISEEYAISLAEEAAVTLEGWSFDRLSTYYYQPITSLRRISDDKVIWFLKYRLKPLYCDEGFRNEIPWGIKVSINAMNGEVVSAEEYYSDSPYSDEKE